MITDWLLVDRPRSLDLMVEVSTMRAVMVTPQLTIYGASDSTRGVVVASVLLLTKESELRVWSKGQGRSITLSRVSVSHGVEDVVSVGEGGSSGGLSRTYRSTVIGIGHACLAMYIPVDGRVVSIN